MHVANYVECVLMNVWIEVPNYYLVQEQHFYRFYYWSN